MALNSIFPKKKLLVNGKKKGYTQVLHFYNFKINEDSKEQNQYFACKICDAKLQSPLNDFSNLNKHLLKHEFSKKWYNELQNYKKKPTAKNRYQMKFTI